jgi:hypothetical protein
VRISENDIHKKPNDRCQLREEEAPIVKEAKPLKRLYGRELCTYVKKVKERQGKAIPVTGRGFP